MKEALGQLWHPVALIINYRSYFLNWKWNQHKKYIKSLTAVFVLFFTLISSTCYSVRQNILWGGQFLQLPSQPWKSLIRVQHKSSNHKLWVRFTVHHPWKRTETQIQWSWMKLEGRNYDGWIKRKNGLASVQAVYLFLSLFFVSAPHTPYPSLRPHTPYPSHIIFSGSFSIEVHSFL